MSAKVVVVVHSQTVVCVDRVVGTWSTYQAAERWAQRRYGDRVEWEVIPLETHRTGASS